VQHRRVNLQVILRKVAIFRYSSEAILEEECPPQRTNGLEDR